MIIYKITNKIDGKVYVGQTRQPLWRRWRDHGRIDRRRKANYLQRAMQKHGTGNFTIEQIDTATTQEGLNALEAYYISKFDCRSPKGYNLCSGGNVRQVHAETRLKLSKTLQANKEATQLFIKHRWTQGFVGKHTPETKLRIRRSLRANKDAIQSLLKNRWTKGNVAPRSAATRRRISESLTGQPQPSKYKPVFVPELNQMFPSVQAAASALGVARTIISTCLRTGKSHCKRGSNQSLTYQFVATKSA